MATGEAVRFRVRCWKRVACAGCGCVFRLPYRREVRADGPTDEAVEADARRRLARSVGRENDPVPCPGCGWVQPGMIGLRQAEWHRRVAVGAAAVVGLLAGLAAGGVVSGKTAGYLAMTAGAWAAAAQLIVASRNPNRDVKANRGDARELEEGGRLEVVAPGTSAAGKHAPGGATGWHWLGVLGSFLAAIVLAAPAAAGNRSPGPDVTALTARPGEEITVAFSDPIDCVDHQWNGTASVVVKNAADLPGGPADIPAVSQTARWSDRLPANKALEHTSPPLWAKVTLPADSRFAGKTLELRVELKVDYPSVQRTGVVQDRSLTAWKELSVRLGPAYLPGGRTSGWLGLLFGGLMLVAAGYFLATLGDALAEQGTPPVVDIPDSELDRGRDDIRRRPLRM